ncbi:hypothetical protein CEUSTIGMA_g8693.t1 [Chlamydomonas eustigma]|uniref:Exonuclease domain-containing protein n=1 Tax=Chlamydomonas eustigma TaxID=1157962 RepID=A0A250XDZ0_9CHLO|nr:hypothetical protein CEUSTIGMA_g8693.t1 [Chlamydomonas eustigma]|eukprot:GAX81261.1 hypothetical protein CEUSTIGMA_g8693.t1 [Chlamydomonas eustigma]
MFLSIVSRRHHKHFVTGRKLRCKPGSGSRFDTRIFQPRGSKRTEDAFSLLPVALDVEFTHLLLTDGTVTSVASQVCVISCNNQQPVLLKDFFRHELLDICSAKNILRPAVERSTGGVPLARLHGAPSLEQVASQILELWDGRILIGHGLSKDLHALGLADCTAGMPSYDTMTFEGFQGRGGCSKSLKKLAKEHLGLDIQKHGVLHDPEEDANAVMNLYMLHARPRLLQKNDDLVAHYELIIRNGLKTS